MKPPSRLLLLTPSAFPSVTGNAMTAERWRRALEEKGIAVKVMATQDLPASALYEEMDRFRPDLIHAHHALRSGGLLLAPAGVHSRVWIHLVVSPAGTDINGDLSEGPRREIILKIFQGARAIIAQGPATRQRLEEILPRARRRIFSVPKSVAWFGEENIRLREIAGCRPGSILLLFPAGIRPVKGNLECLRNLEKVHSLRPHLRAVFAGPALDSDYAAQFEKEIIRLAAFARWINPIPPAAMRSAYEEADVVLNASFSEGLANAVLEGMAAGRPLLASDIPGNRGPVLGEKGDDPSGILFNPQDPEDFLKQALRLIDDEDLRSSLGQAGKKRAKGWPSPEEEAEGLIRAYEFARQSS